MPGRAFVLGGGVAGIAASFELRDRGYAVELLEARSRLGGRVFSFEDSRLGETLDNGPHVMLGCYDAMRRLLRRIGTEHEFAPAPRLELAYREVGGRSHSLRLSRLPVPLAMPAALFGLAGLSWGDRLRALRGMISSLRKVSLDWSFADWLRLRGQEGGPRRFLWDPLCLAVMNAEAHEVSAELFLATLRQAFGGRASRAAIWIPKAPWSAIVGDAAARALDREGITVTTRFAVRELVRAEDRVVRIEARDVAREVGPQDIVVSAMPWHRILRLVPDHLPAGVKAFEARAIINVYFDFGETSVLPDEGPLIALVDGMPFQFVYRGPGAAVGKFVLIASGCTELEGASVAAIEARARDELARYYPSHALPAGGSVRVTKEPMATLCAAPGIENARPAPGRLAGLQNLMVCGDWTQTQLPSTLEGAALSGFALGQAGA